MSVHLQREIDKLKKRLLSLCAVVEDQVQMAVRSLLQRDAGMAQGVEDRDRDVDQQEIEVEEECLKILALHQPVAIDLRFIVAVLKINNDLERIGDLAINIAQRTRNLTRHRGVGVPFDLNGMLTKTMAMVKGSADALVASDTALAWKVCEDDEEVDRIHQDAFGKIQEGIRARPDLVDYYVSLLSVSRNLERIADHATNIAEDVIYMVDGEIVRHSGIDNVDNCQADDRET